MTEMQIDEDALFEQLRQLPDFECLPLPARWYKKYNLKPVSVPTTREFIESNHAVKCAIEMKDLPPIFINEPQQNGKLVKVHPPEDIKVEVVSKPYTGTINGVLPSLIDETKKE
jgi:hypothetical protein